MSGYEKLLLRPVGGGLTVGLTGFEPAIWRRPFVVVTPEWVPWVEASVLRYDSFGGVVDVDGLLRADHIVEVSFEPGRDVADGEDVVGDCTARLWDRYGNLVAFGIGHSITDAMANLQSFTVSEP